MENVNGLGMFSIVYHSYCTKLVDRRGDLRWVSSISQRQPYLKIDAGGSVPRNVIFEPGLTNAVSATLTKSGHGKLCVVGFSC